MQYTKFRKKITVQKHDGINATRKNNADLGPAL